jgi:hypothetical protein
LKKIAPEIIDCPLPDENSHVIVLGQENIIDELE